MKEKSGVNQNKKKSLDEAQTPLWFWNDELETEELIRQLKLQTEVGVKCTNPHARTNGGEGYIGGYLDEQWFRDMKTVLDYKKRMVKKCGSMMRWTGRQEPAIKRLRRRAGTGNSMSL